MKKLIFLILLFPLIFNGCTVEDYCEKKELCDLAAKILPIVVGAFGTDIIALTEIYNYAASSVDCTDTAPSSNSQYTLEKKVGNSFEPYNGLVNDPSASLSDGVKVTPSLKPNEVNDNLSFKFILRDAGTYRWVLKADYDLKIIEREEVNNIDIGGTGRIGVSNNIAYSNEFEIVEDPFIDVSNLPKFEIRFH